MEDNWLPIALRCGRCCRGLEWKVEDMGYEDLVSVSISPCKWCMELSYKNGINSIKLTGVPDET